jgi:catechol 2,3-dioxygenase-like lactoylglutathione lyase family enzyme
MSEASAMTVSTSKVPQLLAFDHAGVRVVDRQRSIDFYSLLGFVLDPDAGEQAGRTVELINAHGVRLNLIVNGNDAPDHRNILMDVPEKWPGWTHPAFTVESLDAVIAAMEANGIAITEGPVDWGRRRVCSVRDPHLNVGEFDELNVAHND